MTTELKDALAAVAEQVKSFQARYRQYHAEYMAVGEELRQLNEAPPSRADLERLLTKTVDRFAATHTERLREQVGRFIADPEKEEHLVEVFSNGFRNYPDANGLPALLRPALLAGVKDFAANCSWPDGAIDQADRVKRRDELTPRLQALAEEIAALQSQAAQVGVKLS